MKNLKEEFKRNKKGAEMWQLLLIIIGVAVAVLVIVGISGGLGKIFGVFDKADDLEITVQACNSYAQGNLETSYCRIFHEAEIVGEAQYVNCDYLGNKGYLNYTLSCGGINIQKLAGDYCKNEELKDNKKVNGKTCEEWSQS